MLDIINPWLNSVHGKKKICHWSLISLSWNEYILLWHHQMCTFKPTHRKYLSKKKRLLANLWQKLKNNKKIYKLQIKLTIFAHICKSASSDLFPSLVYTNGKYRPNKWGKMIFIKKKPKCHPKRSNFKCNYCFIDEFLVLVYFVVQKWNWLAHRFHCPCNWLLLLL